MTDGEPTAESRFLERWLPVLLLALAGLMVRVPILFHDHPEGDERLYTALVQQLDSGRGYTLVGHPILGTGHFNPAHYATPLFFHPPGGILVFLGAYRLGGPTGLGSAQLAAFLVFFAGVLVLARGMLGRLSNLQLVVLAALGASTPVVAHVNTKIWIDNPKIALATLGGGLLLLGLREERRLLSMAGGILLGGGCFTKIDTALVLPPLLLVAIVVLRPRRRELVVHFAPAALLSTAAVGGWLLHTHSVTGSFLAGNPGRPTAEFLAQNAFLRLVTVDRPAISYFVNLPAVMPTLAVVLLAGGAFTVAGAWRRRRVFASGGAWILFVVLVYVALGLVGYSKLLRYAILAVPPAVVLFADLFGALVDDPLPIGTGMRRLLVALATAALLAECAIGLKVALVDWDLAFIPAIL